MFGDRVKLERMAVVRLYMRNDFPNSWLSDYVINYKEEYDDALKIDESPSKYIR